MTASRFLSPELSARAEPLRGHPTSGRTGCRRNSPRGRDIPASGAKRSHGWPVADDKDKMIHVIGNAAVDSVVRVDRFPRPGETIVAHGASEDLGGKGANQAIAAARCGVDVRLVAAIGDDAEGMRIRSSLAREGVLADGLTVLSHGTDRCVITVDGRGENTILSVIDGARNFEPIAETPIESWVRPGDFVVMQGNLRAAVTRDC